jgi:hypothetical protein
LKVLIRPRRAPRCNLDIAGQQFCDAIGRVIGDAAEHFAQVGFGIETVELGGFNQRLRRDCVMQSLHL